MLRTICISGLALIIAVLLTAPGARAAGCEVFIDRGDPHFAYRVRQLVKIELNGYVRTSSPTMDRDVEIHWSVDPSTAAVVDSDPKTNGRAFFYPGRLERKYTVTARADFAGTPCKPATLTIYVDNDYTHFLEGGGGWSGGSTGFAGRLANEFDAIVPMLLAVGAERYTPNGAPAAEISAQAGVKAIDPRIYLEAGYVHRSTPSLSTGGITAMLERLVDIDRPFSVGWSLGTCFCTFHPLYYSISASYLLPAQRMFVEGGFRGETAASKYVQTSEFLLLGNRL